MSPSFQPFPRDSLRNLALGEHEIQVWSAEIDQTEERVSHLEAILSPDERERAARFVFARDRIRFVVCRSVLRKLLGGYTGEPADSIGFEYGAKGKPELAGRGYCFNLAHSESLAVIGFARSGPLGVDVERIRPMPDGESIVNRFFSSAERTVFAVLPTELKLKAFFNGWTRKEAFVKALGDGLHVALDSFDVSISPGDEPRLLSFEGDCCKAADWSLFHLEPKPGYVAALAIAGRGWKVTAWSLNMGSLIT